MRLFQSVRSRPLTAILVLPLVWAFLSLPIGPASTSAAEPDVSFIAFGDAGLGSAGQLATDADAERDDHEQAQHAELGQQRWPSQKRAHARLIGRWARVP